MNGSPSLPKIDLQSSVARALKSAGLKLAVAGRNSAGRHRVFRSGFSVTYSIDPARITGLRFDAVTVSFEFDSNTLYRARGKCFSSAYRHQHELAAKMLQAAGFCVAQEDCWLVITAPDRESFSNSSARDNRLPPSLRS